MAFATSYRLKNRRPNLRRGHPMAFGLVGAWSWYNGYGMDCIGFSHLVPTTGIDAPTYDGAQGVKYPTANSLHVLHNLPTSLRLQLPLSIVFRGFQIATPGSGWELFGVQYNLANAAPFVSYGLTTNSGPTAYQVRWNNGSLQQVSMAAGITTNAPVFLAGALKTGTQNGYKNSSAVSGSPGVASGTISYASDSEVFFSGGGINKTTFEYGLIYNRFLSDAEIGWLIGNGNDLFTRPRGWAGWVAALQGAQVNRRRRVICSGEQ